ncbi:HAAS signaling domain-containing protein [Cytobacillus purgationiresistens]|uniref:Uncharacterized protein n=1 Tax=Cytobacillus purgationiresistens TaxID=863449 RepID=A0ABU0ANP7_9BACI|nr:hypothetical protein [Cytobacillus purgationiresistens]MDQ0272655.1 hypothetical protein [Cytobacillus purgationiresistens]
MKWIDIYVHEVSRRLPENTREDIALELKSTILDMLPDQYSEEDEKSALAELGDPAAMADEYRDKPTYLIGPGFYDGYLSTLKMVMPIVLFFTLSIYFIESYIQFAKTANDWTFLLHFFGEGIWNVINVGIQALFWITLVFFIIERSGVAPYQLSSTGKEWKPEDLKNVTVIPKKKAINKGEVFSSLLWTAIWGTVYFTAIDYIGVYRGAGGQPGLELITPIFNQSLLLSCWPIIVVFLGVEIALTIFKWIKGQWTQRLAMVNTIYHILYTGLFLFIILQSNLFHPDFFNYMGEIFNSTLAEVESVAQLVIGISIASVILTSAYSSYEGFKKAKIKLDPYKNSDSTK